MCNQHPPLFIVEASLLEELPNGHPLSPRTNGFHLRTHFKASSSSSLDLNHFFMRRPAPRFSQKVTKAVFGKITKIPLLDLSAKTESHLCEALACFATCRLIQRLSSCRQVSPIRLPPKPTWHLHGPPRRLIKPVAPNCPFGHLCPSCTMLESNDFTRHRRSF